MTDSKNELLDMLHLPRFYFSDYVDFIKNKIWALQSVTLNDKTYGRKDIEYWLLSGVNKKFNIEIVDGNEVSVVCAVKAGIDPSFIITNPGHVFRMIERHEEYTIEKLMNEALIRALLQCV